MNFPPRPISSALAILLALLPNVAVAADRPVVKEVELIGVTAFDKETVLEYLYMDETSWWSWTTLWETFYYTGGFAREDGDRLTKLYQSYGYYKARVLEVKAVPLNKEGSKVKVVFRVDEGPPTLVRRVEVAWPEGDRGNKIMERLIGLKVGKPFSIKALLDSSDRIRVALEMSGHALPVVEERAEVDRPHGHADVFYTIKPGQRHRVAALRFDGLHSVPQSQVEAEVDFAIGKAYSPSLLKRIEASCYAMDVFDSVSVLADQGKGRDLTLVVRLTESRTQSIKVGGGIGIEPNRWDVHASTLYTHRNIFGHMIRLDLRGMLGYAVMPYPWDVQEHGPVVKVMPYLKKKGWLERRLVWSAQPSFELGIEEGYKFTSTMLRFGVSRFFFGILSADLSYNTQLYDFFDKSDVFDQGGTALGKDFRDPYFLCYLELNLRLYLTNSILTPKRGAIFSLTTDLAGFYLGSQYDFIKITPEIRAYWMVFSRMQLVFRAQTGFIFPYGITDAAPLSMVYYLGGADTVRGWGLKRLSPQVEECSDSDCDSVSVGGYTQIMANLELRFRVWGDLFLTLFADMGDVQPGVVEFHPTQWSYSTGGGLGYDSPIGKFRLDFGYRINALKERFGDEERWALHLSFGDPF